MNRDGNRDLFVAALIVLPLAALVSAVSIGSNIAFLHRLAVTRRAQLQRRRVPRRDHEKHCEAKNGNDIALHQIYLSTLLLLIEVHSIACCRSR